MILGFGEVDESPKVESISTKNHPHCETARLSFHYKYKGEEKTLHIMMRIWQLESLISDLQALHAKMKEGIK